MTSTAHRPLPSTLAGRFGRLVAVVGLLAVVLSVRAESPADKKNLTLDKDRQIVHRIVDLQPLRLEGGDEREPYEDVVLHANGFTQDELFDAARQDIGLSEMLHKEPSVRDSARFELIHIQGSLKRLKKIESTGRLREAGIAELYEAWIFPRGGRGLDPVCVILTEPPAGIKPADDITPGLPVTTAGYFFKLLEYQSNQPNPNDASRTMFHRAPLLLGRSLTVGKEQGPDNASVYDLVTLSLVFGGIVAVALLGLAVWLRRSDTGSRRAYKNRLRNPYTAPPDNPFDDSPPGTPPA